MQAIFARSLLPPLTSSIDAPISDLRPWKCKPSNLANSPHLIDVSDAILAVKKETHAAVANLMGGSYEQYLRTGNFYERSILNVCVSKLPQEFAKPFNLYDLARQFFDGTVDEKTGKTWDIVVGGLVKQTVTDSPLAPCPGISVATSLADADKWLVPVFTPEWTELVENKSGKEYHKQFITRLFTASNWEAERWLKEYERMMEEAKRLNSKSFEALAMWICLAATNRFQYAALLRNSKEPGFLSLELKEKFRSNLKRMQERHFSQGDK